jgi:ribonuclease III
LLKKIKDIFTRSLLKKYFFKSRDEENGFSADYSHSKYSSPDKFNIELLEKKINYKVSDKRIFFEALTHRSFSQNVFYNHFKSNERLEFLGDSVLNLIIGEYLYHLYPDGGEGKLTKVRSRLVNRRALLEFAKKIDLVKFLYLNPNAIIEFSKGIESILADAFESLIAAIYLDGGYDAAKDFVERIVIRDHILMSKVLIDDNYKSNLLEYTQSQGLGTPKYETINTEGPNHNPVFTVQVIVGQEVYADGKGRNKKEAEQEAAKNALSKLAII